MTCAVEECDRAARVRGWCDRHYRRWRKFGDVEVVRKRGPIQAERPACSIEECGGVVHGRGFCRLHYQRWKNTGDPLGNRREQRGPEHYGWRGDEVGYFAVHRRLRRIRGDAARLICEHCGEPAVNWAYDHSDPDEKVSPEGWPFSTALERYLALCKSCHVLLDQRSVS